MILLSSCAGTLLLQVLQQCSGMVGRRRIGNFCLQVTKRYLRQKRKTIRTQQVPMRHMSSKYRRQQSRRLQVDCWSSSVAVQRAIHAMYPMADIASPDNWAQLQFSDKTLAELIATPTSTSSSTVPTVTPTSTFTSTTQKVTPTLSTTTAPTETVTVTTVGQMAGSDIAIVGVVIVIAVIVVAVLLLRKKKYLRI